MKDHKESFPNKISCHLINPSKSSIGKTSKVILDKINSHIQKETSANQWKDTSSVIDGLLISKKRNVHLSWFLILKVFTLQSQNVYLLMLYDLQNK